MVVDPQLTDQVIVQSSHHQSDGGAVNQRPYLQEKSTSSQFRGTGSQTPDLPNKLCMMR